MSHALSDEESSGGIGSIVWIWVDLCAAALSARNLKADEGRFSLYEKVAWSSDPTSGNCIVVIMQSFDRIPSFARVGGARWGLLHARTFYSGYEDFFYNGENGLFYAVRRNGERSIPLILMGLLLW
jgi:hypothetical protein